MPSEDPRKGAPAACLICMSLFSGTLCILWLLSGMYTQLWSDRRHLQLMVGLYKSLVTTLVSVSALSETDSSIIQLLKGSRGSMQV
jgi:hypothetical protein